MPKSVQIAENFHRKSESLDSNPALILVQNAREVLAWARSSTQAMTRSRFSPSACLLDDLHPKSLRFSVKTSTRARIFREITRNFTKIRVGFYFWVIKVKWLISTLKTRPGTRSPGKIEQKRVRGMFRGRSAGRIRARNSSRDHGLKTHFVFLEWSYRAKFLSTNLSTSGFRLKTEFGMRFKRLALQNVLGKILRGFGKRQNRFLLWWTVLTFPRPPTKFSQVPIH